MRAFVLTVLLFPAGLAHSEVARLAIRSGLVLKPNQAYTVTIEANSPTEIGWEAVQVKRCSANCVQATELIGRTQMTFAAALGGSTKYTPAAGQISIEYRNISSEPVTINIFRVRRTCDAEACKFLNGDTKSRWLVYKISSFKSITTSRDGSFSVISGTVMSGRAFTVRAVWWTDDRNVAPFQLP